MGRLSSFLLAILIVITVSCTDGEIPAGLHGYQVTRLLTHDSTKVWQINRLDQNNCNQAYYYQFDAMDDSIEFREIRWNCTAYGFTDTVFVSKGLPSTLGIAFTDSIRWLNERDWLVRAITEYSLSIQDVTSSETLDLTYFK